MQTVSVPFDGSWRQPEMVPGWGFAYVRSERTLLAPDEEQSTSRAKELSKLLAVEAVVDGSMLVKGNKDELWSMWRAPKSISLLKASGNMSEPWPETVWLRRAVEVRSAVDWPRLFDRALEYADSAMPEAAS